MQIKVINDTNIKDEDITSIVKNVNILLINSNNELLITNSFNTYNLLAGYAQDCEILKDTEIRIIKQETGIVIDDVPEEAFFLRKKYINDYPLIGDKSLYENYYFVVHTDLKPIIDKISYSNNRRFSLEYISMDNIEELLTKNRYNNPHRESIAIDILEAIDVYKNMIN